ncbi:trans-acting regulatory protein of aco operon [Klebsiella michiganensis]|uniref:Trans-acting regulatory protein of aco operon n=1 Tax=Klebsiella michiganensis TaxID=1134687 RepID=A0A7H4MZK0_9ENTR|nr:trans-acting regulatory protein of aco operon [Klebsiella michiganensis]
MPGYVTGLQSVMIVKRYWHGLSGTIFFCQPWTNKAAGFATILFLQETLRTILQQNNDINLKHLHELASHWFVEQRLWSEAVRHALAAGKPIHNPGQDGAGAQSLAEEGDIDTLVSWMHHLPASTDPSRIDLQINLAWALAHYFRFDESRQLLDNLDQMVR